MTSSRRELVMAGSATFHAEGSVLFVGGVFDTGAAVKLRALAARLATDADDAGAVVVDFSRAREVTATGLAALVDAFGDAPRPPRFRGLSHHHQRILQHLGSTGRPSRAG